MDNLSDPRRSNKSAEQLSQAREPLPEFTEANKEAADVDSTSEEAVAVGQETETAQAEGQRPITEGPHGHALIELGITVAGGLDRVDSIAVEQAARHLKDKLIRLLPEFDWSVAVSTRRESVHSASVEAIEMLTLAAEERERHAWDFCIVVTAAELIGYYRPFCSSVLSRPLDSAATSTSRLDPRSIGEELPESDRVELVAQRLLSLMLQAVMHLSGARESRDPDNLLFHPDDVVQLDRMQSLPERTLESVVKNLRQIADMRLEENPLEPKTRLLFTLKSTWINRVEILSAIWAARPWEFPKRLGRLMTATVSSAAILLLTAEAWDLGLSQEPWRLWLLFLASLSITTWFVAERQRLLARHVQPNTEQAVVTRLSAISIVIIGMLVTWLATFALSLGAAKLLFHDSNVKTWAESSRLSLESVWYGTYAQMAVFTASIGLLIGALGASFESNTYFRHIIFVDDEI